MRHEIPRGNWTAHLASAIKQAQPGDTIVCHSPEMGWMGRRAAERLRREGLRFELEDGAEVPIEDDADPTP